MILCTKCCVLTEIACPLLTTLNAFVLFSDNAQAPGFRASFVCGGEPVEYWKPSDVATVLEMGETVNGLAPSSVHAQCLDGVLLSVQCCADAATDCANARVISLGLSGQQLRGSLPEAIGSLGALNSLKVTPHSSLLPWFWSR